MFSFVYYRYIWIRSSGSPNLLVLLHVLLPSTNLKSSVFNHWIHTLKKRIKLKSRLDCLSSRKLKGNNIPTVKTLKYGWPSYSQIQNLRWLVFSIFGICWFLKRDRTSIVQQPITHKLTQICSFYLRGIFFAQVSILRVWAYHVTSALVINAGGYKQTDWLMYCPFTAALRADSEWGINCCPLSIVQSAVL